MTDYNELVRCGECKFWSETEKGFGRCLKSGFKTPKDFLGEDGERKDQGMTDYTKLVAALRCVGECHEGCPYRTSYGNCSAHSAKLEQDAADAIEELDAEETRLLLLTSELQDKLMDLQASPWHRVEDGLPEMIEIVPCYVCSETLVLYDAESGYMDIGYVREKPDNNGADWLWGKPFKNPTHWMPIEPPKEDE